LSTAVTEPTIEPPLVGVSDTVNPHFAFAASTSPLVHGFAPEGATLYSPEAVRLESVIADLPAVVICAVPL
jgi:hypothetical protein